MRHTVTVSIVSYNTRDQLRRCLAGLAAASAGFDLSITVVDNASTDGSAGMVALEFPEVRLLALSRNLGFAGGNNEALRDCTSRYALILNPDVEIGADALRSLVEFMEETPHAAAAAPLLCGSDGAPHTHLYRRFPTAIQLGLFWTIIAPLARSIPQARRRWFEHDLRGERPVAVDQIAGAAMLIRTAMLRTVGEMDPDYFMWFEDVDWCFRARQAGHSLYVLPRATALHEGGASFRSWGMQTRVFQFYRAFFRFLCKHRLDRLQRFALPLLSADLMVKQVVLSVMRPVSRTHADRGVSLAAARRAMRHVVARHAAGELVRFTADDIPNAGVGTLAHPSASPVRHSDDSVVEAVPPVQRAGSGQAPHDDHALVDAIIVNWNGRRFLPACIRALARSTVPIRITVVDNASTDDSLACLRTDHPDVNVLALETNAGYAAGANRGIAATTAAYVIIMNPDVRLAPDHLAVLREHLERDASVGAAQGKLMQIDAEAFAAQRDATGGRIDSAGHVIHRSRMVTDRGQGEPDGPGFSRAASVFSACGAALFLRRDMLTDVAPDGEYFAESFFAYKEDIDLGWRARLLGWDIRYIPAAAGYHVRALPLTGDAWRHMSLAARRHSWKNHYLLMIRNDRVSDLIRSFPFVAAWEVVRIGHALLRDPRVLGAYVDLVREIRPALRARRDIQRRRRASIREIRRWFGGDPVPAPGWLESGRSTAVLP